MKITFLGNFSVDYGSETYHKKALESLGHEVTVFQETQAGSKMVLDEALRSDLFMWVHTQGWHTPGKLTMKQKLSTLKQVKISSVSYQAASHEECFIAKPTKTGYQHDVVFVGSKGYHPEWPYRPTLVNRLKDTYSHRFAHYDGDGLGVTRGLSLKFLYADSKIAIGDLLCLNFDHKYYWSNRVYQTLGRGGFIIHPYIEGMEEREEICHAGHEHVAHNHTYRNHARHAVIQHEEASFILDVYAYQVLKDGFR